MSWPVCPLTSCPVSRAVTAACRTRCPCGQACLPSDQLSRVPGSDSRLPDTLSAQERRQQATELERVKKWLQMLSGRQEHKWSSRVYKGIPDRVRGRVWQHLLHVQEQRQRHAGLYDELRHEARLWSPDVRQIDLDVNRTFRDHIMFRERYGIKQQALFHVLGGSGPRASGLIVTMGSWSALDRVCLHSSIGKLL